MTEDLEATLAELGPESRLVVDRLMAAYRPMRAAALPPARRRWWARRRPVGYLAAASLAAALGLGVLFGLSRAGSSAGPLPDRVYTVRATTAENEYLLAIVRDDAAVQEMIRTQRPDGSWKNDFLTRQNAAALMHCKGEAAQVAFRKAIRHLRAREAQ